ncbi:MULTISPECIES: hypothetical protein [Sporomusa]|uniref:hypothetical protein n=1 Tax=Sporomusa TaxID=2375 RepID=UPI0031584602
MDVDTYLKKIEYIANCILVKYLVCNDPIEWWDTKGLDDNLIAKISELALFKRKIILPAEKIEAEANWIRPIDMLEIPYEKRIIMRSIYFEAEKIVRPKAYKRKFDKYELCHPIFVDKELFRNRLTRKWIES